MNANKKEFDAVLVHWMDAETAGGVEWQSLDDVESYVSRPSPVMVSVGFLIFETPGENGFICITDTLGDSETSNVHKIPNRMVMTRQTIKAQNEY